MTQGDHLRDVFPHTMVPDNGWWNYVTSCNVRTTGRVSQRRHIAASFSNQWLPSDGMHRYLFGANGALTGSHDGQGQEGMVDNNKRVPRSVCNCDVWFRFTCKSRLGTMVFNRLHWFTGNLQGLFFATPGQASRSVGNCDVWYWFSCKAGLVSSLLDWLLRSQ